MPEDTEEIEIHDAAAPRRSSHLDRTMSLAGPLPGLHTPHRKRKLIIWIGVALLVLDLCVLPIAYYYALHFGTNLSLQNIFAIITAVYGLLSFSHYSLRSLKLFRNKGATQWRPIGWTKWGMMEFLHINILVCITLFEIELVAGTAPNRPIIRLVAMPSPTICFYFGFLFCVTAALTQMRIRLPFHMSSTQKGALWKPALLAFIEDAGAIEGQGGHQYRAAVLQRYDASPRFRKLILNLSWIWGLGLIFIAIISTILIMLLNEDIGFGVGWGLPWAFSAVYALMTAIYVKRELIKEKVEWRAKEAATINASVAEV